MTRRSTETARYGCDSDSDDDEGLSLLLGDGPTFRNTRSRNPGRPEIKDGGNALVLEALLCSKEDLDRQRYVHRLQQDNKELLSSKKEEDDDDERGGKDGNGSIKREDAGGGIFGDTAQFVKDVDDDVVGLYTDGAIPRSPLGKRLRSIDGFGTADLGSSTVRTLKRVKAQTAVSTEGPSPSSFSSSSSSSRRGRSLSAARKSVPPSSLSSPPISHGHRRRSPIRVYDSYREADDALRDVLVELIAREGGAKFEPLDNARKAGRPAVIGFLRERGMLSLVGRDAEELEPKIAKWLLSLAVSGTNVTSHVSRYALDNLLILQWNNLLRFDESFNLWNGFVSMLRYFLCDGCSSDRARRNYDSKSLPVQKSNADMGDGSRCNVFGLVNFLRYWKCVLQGLASGFCPNEQQRRQVSEAVRVLILLLLDNFVHSPVVAVNDSLHREIQQLFLLLFELVSIGDDDINRSTDDTRNSWITELVESVWNDLRPLVLLPDDDDYDDGGEDINASNNLDGSHGSSLLVYFNVIRLLFPDREEYISKVKIEPVMKTIAQFQLELASKALQRCLDVPDMDKLVQMTLGTPYLDFILNREELNNHSFWKALSYAYTALSFLVKNSSEAKFFHPDGSRSLAIVFGAALTFEVGWFYRFHERAGISNDSRTMTTPTKGNSTAERSECLDFGTKQQAKRVKDFLLLLAGMCVEVSGFASKKLSCDYFQRCDYQVGLFFKALTSFCDEAGRSAGESSGRLVQKSVQDFFVVKSP